MMGELVFVRTISKGSEVWKTKEAHAKWLKSEQDKVEELLQELTFDLCGTKQVRCALSICKIVNNQGVDLEDWLFRLNLQERGLKWSF